MREETLPALLASHPAGLLRAWVAGCSTGEEAYSLAIVFKEVMEKLKPRKNFKLQIFATDLDRDAIDKARQGVFPESISADVSPEQLRRYFTKEERGYRVRAEIREMVIFSPHSLIMDPPFTKLDFLSCRNLLIYLAPEMQKKLFPLFHYSLNPGGILFLGNAETIGHFTDLFATVSGKSRIFRRMESAVRPDPVEFPSSFAPAMSDGSAALSGDASRISISSHKRSSWSCGVTPRRRCSSMNRETSSTSADGPGNIWNPPAGKANLNIFAMARDGLRYELTAAFQKALRQPGPVVMHGLKIETDGAPQFADITVEKLEETEPLAGLVIDRFFGNPRACGNESAGTDRKDQRAASPPVGSRAGTASGAGGTAEHARGNADLPGGTQVHQRGDAVHQRGNAIHQRGTHHLQGGNAVARMKNCKP